MSLRSRGSGKDLINVLIVDDHPLFRSGLQRALELEDDINIIGFSNDGESAIEDAEDLRPDVIILDINLPGMNGLQVARRLRGSSVQSAIIILTAHHDDEQVIHALRTGAAAYCAKDVHPERLVAIIRIVASGQYVVKDKRMNQHEFEQWLSAQLSENTPHMTDAEGYYIPLSPREMEILEAVTRGLINKEIAQKLGISQQTVKNHMTSILKKLNVNDRTQAAVTALRRGWVRIDSDSHQEV